jgi:hypothetical protein
LTKKISSIKGIESFFQQNNSPQAIEFCPTLAHDNYAKADYYSWFAEVHFSGIPCQASLAFRTVKQTEAEDV